MNKADNISGSKAIDSLINFETVKVFTFNLYNTSSYIICTCSSSTMKLMKQMNMTKFLHNMKMPL